MNVRKKGKKTQYWMLAPNCIGMPCFAPGVYQHRGATLSGSRNTGSTSATCMTNAYRGCPSLKYSGELERDRKREGWKNVGQ